MKQEFEVRTYHAKGGYSAKGTYPTLELAHNAMDCKVYKEVLTSDWRRENVSLYQERVIKYEGYLTAFDELTI